MDPSVLYVVEDRVMTSAGTAAGIDLCLYVVACDHGAEVAATVARRMVMPLYRTGGQAQYVDTPIAAGNTATRWRSCSLGARRTSRAGSPWTTSRAAPR